MRIKEVLKSAITLALSNMGIYEGYGKEDNFSELKKSQSSILEITPKQTAKYSYSTPLPLNYEWIDKAYEFNKTLKKGKITTFYNSVPIPAVGELFIYHSGRGGNKDIKTIDDFIKYVKYAQKKVLILFIL